MTSGHSHEFDGTERFTIEERIGTGATGVVYRAHDNERGTSVALKLLKRFDPMALYRFKQEFRALSDVIHPNLVSLYELVSAGEQWFFTMELVEGVDILTYVRHGPGIRGPVTDRLPRLDTMQDAHDETADTVTLPNLPSSDLPSSSSGTSDSVVDLASARRPVHIAPPASNEDQFERLRLVSIQLAEGVSALHDAGQLHRDIKPSNILVTDEGRVVILDFGVVAELTPQGATTSHESRLVGTPAYMSPEQGGGGAIGPHSDWYSVGVVIYEALTGRRPFAGAAREMIAAKQQRDPRPPHEISLDIPDDLSRLCMDLMARDPTARPTGRHVVDRLGGNARPSQPKIAPRVGSDVAFVGRGAHIEMLRAAYAVTQTGEARTVFVHGSSGMGKTALVSHFLDELREQGEAVVLSGRCYERESVPYKALDDLVDALSRHLAELPRRDVWDMMPQHVHALARLFPVLRRVEAVLGAARQELENLDPHELRRRAFDSLRDLLASLARRAPLVLSIDDVQWGDSDSAALLAHVMRPMSAPPLLLIAAYRREDAGTSPLLRALLPAQQSSVSLAVDPLTREESERLALELLGEDNRITRTFARSIARESGGNPFFVDELVRFVQDHESGGHVSIGSDVTLDTVLSTRVDELSRDARALLEAVAIAGRPVSQAVVMRASELGAHEQPALSALRGAHLVHTRGTRDRDEIECLHDRVRVAVISGMSAEQRRQMHARLASIFEASGEGDAETLSLHYEGAGELERASRYCVEAADAALEGLAFGRAAALYRRALDLGQLEFDEECRLRGRLGDALSNAGRRAEAAEEYREAARVDHPAERFEYARRAAEAYLHSGHVDEGMRALDEVLRAVGLRIPADERGSLFGFLLRRLWIRVRGLKFRERDPSELAPMDLSRVDALWSASIGFAMCDLMLGVDFQSRHLLAALRAGDRSSALRALAAEGAFRSVGGRRGMAHALEVARRALELAEDENDPLAISYAHASAGLVQYQIGEFQEAWKQTEKAVSILAGRYGASWENATMSLYRVWALYYLGEGAEFVRSVQGLVDQAQDRGDLYSVTNLSTGIPNSVWLFRDDLEEARSRMRDAMGRWTRRNYHLQHYWHLVSQTNADIYAGAGAEAWRRVTDEWSDLARSRLLRVTMVRVEARHGRVRAAILSARDGDERERMLKAAERDARKLEREKMTFTDALATLARAGIASVRGDPESAEPMPRGRRVQRDLRLGRLRGGDEGAALVADAQAFMREQSVANPERFADFLAPGRWATE